MFESLDEHIKHDKKVETTPAERWLPLLVAVVGGVILIMGLYFGVQMLE